jgi:hypothetical protein
MILLKFYAKLQFNPRSSEVYRKISEEYKKLGMENESKAFEELIKNKFNVNNSNINEK